MLNLLEANLSDRPQCPGCKGYNVTVQKILYTGSMPITVAFGKGLFGMWKTKVIRRGLYGEAEYGYEKKCKDCGLHLYS